MIWTSKKDKEEAEALLKEQKAAEREAYAQKEKRDAKAAKQAEKEEAKSVKVSRSETSSTGYRAAAGSVDPETGKKVGGQFVEPTTSQLGTSGDMLMTLQAIYQEVAETGAVVE